MPSPAKQIKDLLQPTIAPTMDVEGETYVVDLSDPYTKEQYTASQEASKSEALDFSEREIPAFNRDDDWELVPDPTMENYLLMQPALLLT